MTIFKKIATLSLIATSLGLQAGAFAAPVSLPTALPAVLPVVKQYQTIGWSSGDGVQNTVNAVGGLAYAGDVSTAADLVGTDILVAGNWNSAFLSWVAAGGVYVWHDWNLVASQLPGMRGLVSGSYSGSDINVIDSTSAIVNGPKGTIDDVTLDGGTSSTHGTWKASSLVSTDALVHDIHAILSSTNASDVVMFEMGYGAGHILYASIPLEAYTDSAPLVTGSQPAGLRVYAGNELAYARTLSLAPDANDVPEPGTALLAVLALGAAGAVRRKAKAKA